MSLLPAMPLAYRPMRLPPAAAARKGPGAAKSWPPAPVPTNPWGWTRRLCWCPPGAAPPTPTPTPLPPPRATPPRADRPTRPPGIEACWLELTPPRLRTPVTRASMPLPIPPDGAGNVLRVGLCLKTLLRDISRCKHRPGLTPTAHDHPFCNAIASYLKQHICINTPPISTNEVPIESSRLGGNDLVNANLPDLSSKCPILTSQTKMMSQPMRINRSYKTKHGWILYCKLPAVVNIFLTAASFSCDGMPRKVLSSFITSSGDSQGSITFPSMIDVISFDILVEYGARPKPGRCLFFTILSAEPATINVGCCNRLRSSSNDRWNKSPELYEMMGFRASLVVRSLAVAMLT
mmetsp:Transcript_24183/g.69525  ORF Transcript_24183/g.69525 Transcript_24183/m.69525 type:complete len:349 (-) Transcript_24183:946-1992(-)